MYSEGGVVMLSSSTLQQAVIICNYCGRTLLRGRVVCVRWFAAIAPPHPSKRPPPKHLVC